MTRHLRSVDTPLYEVAFAVTRSQHVQPGVPFVLAECADDRVAVVFALAGQEVHGRRAMERDPELAQALAAWEAGDQELFIRERAARGAFKRADLQPGLRSVTAHPSMLGTLAP